MLYDILYLRKEIRGLCITKEIRLITIIPHKGILLYKRSFGDSEHSGTEVIYDEQNSSEMFDIPDQDIESILCILVRIQRKTSVA